MWGLLCVLLVLAAALWWAWKKRGVKDVISPLPWLGCALAFRSDPVVFLCRIAERGRNVTLNMAGLRMKLLVVPEDVAVFYRSQTLSAEAALEPLGFVDTLGSLNVQVGGQLHNQLIRGGRSFGPDAQERLREATEAALRSHAAGEEMELYRFCRDLVTRFVIEIFAGPAVAELPGFCEEYLAFQLAHEGAIAKAMVLGRTLASFFLAGARRQRVALVRRMAPLLDSRHADQLTEYDSEQRADLIVGLLTAATKNVAIGSATTLVHMLEHGVGAEKAAGAVAETLRMTCLSFGALRVATRGSGEQFSEGELLTVSHLARGRNAELFPSPHQWDSSRKSVDVGFCFGSGVHACPGRTFAIESMATIVAAVRPHLGALGKCSALRFDRPSLADREFAFAMKL
jgi:hypothetical protein